MNDKRIVIDYIRTLRERRKMITDNSSDKFANIGHEDINDVYCPECKSLTTFEADHEVSCEDCGSHAAVKCLECGEYFDHVWGYERIIKYNQEKEELEV